MRNKFNNGGSIETYYPLTKVPIWDHQQFIYTVYAINMQTQD